MVDALQRRGFKVLRQRGSHVRLEGPDGRKVTVPVHVGRNLPRGTLRNILQQAGLSEEGLE